MNAREEILASIRRALGPADRAEQVVPRGYRSAVAVPDLVELFVARVEDYQASVSRCGEAEVVTAIRDALGDARRVLVPDGFEYPVEGAVADAGQSAAELDELDAVVTGATVGIATTGTIVLDHRSGQGRRAMSLVPDVHVCVLREDQIVPGVPEAVAALDPRRPQTWISGPSATSDIELNRVEGVHGPRHLFVIVVPARPNGGPARVVS